jgi:hypothetical protein
MTNRIFWLIAMAVAAMFLVAPHSAQAQTRTWVSGVGDDVNPCSRTAPCKTFAGAISKTAAGGEINCIDNGAYGSVTIVKSIAIVCDGVEAGVLASNSNAIVINAAASDTVFLSGLDLFGTNAATSGVRILQAKAVHIARTKIRGFTVAGVNVAPTAAGASIKVEVADSVLFDNPGAGILAKPTSNGIVRIALDRVHVARSGLDGVTLDASTTTGSVKGVISDSVFASNVVNGISIVSNGPAAEAMIDRASVFDNATGISANGAGAVVRFTNSNVSANTTGVAQIGSGFALSFVTNAVAGNTANGTFGTTALK